MAQFVGYYQDDITYLEGPFVVVPMWGDCFRIECESRGVNYSVLLDMSVYRMLEQSGLGWEKTRDRDLAIQRVDWLNEQVKAGKIILGMSGGWKAA